MQKIIKTEIIRVINAFNMIIYDRGGQSLK